MRLAHYSDIHVTASPLKEGLRSFVGKRLAGSVNYGVGGRGRHFEGSDHRIARLLEDVDAQGVDHALCTGDVTQMSFESEFSKCAELYGERLSQPELHTVIPGNHDRYTSEAVQAQRFERHLGALAAPDGEYPLVKRLGEHVVLVALDVAEARPLFDSSGHVGPEQREKLKEILTDDSLVGRFVILALHYGLLRRTGRRDRRTHRLRDDQELIALVDRADVTLDLVLHGHMHRPYRVRTRRRTVFCAGSATDLAGRCGYNVYDIDLETKRVDVERRVWSAATDGYVAW